MNPTHEVLLYYKYFPVEDPESYAEEHRTLCRNLDLLGRILVASEGINGTVSGLPANTRRYRQIMQSQPATAGMAFKVDPAEGHPFQKLSIKARKEIVTLGLPAHEEVDPTAITGTHLSPKEFYQAMQDPGTVLLDARNHYETQLGRFRLATCPGVEHFRDLPQWIRQHRTLLQGKRILTYCTGGVRCEKLTAWLLREGFSDAGQLQGGIVTYGRDPEIHGRDFDGKCYVFDERISLPINRANPTLISHCTRCGQPSDRYRNCAFSPCNAQFFCCATCEETFGPFCSETCRRHQSATPPNSPTGEAQRADAAGEITPA